MMPHSHGAFLRSNRFVALGNLLHKHCTSIEQLRFCRALVIVGTKCPRMRKPSEWAQEVGKKCALGSADSCSFGVHSTEHHRHGPIERKPTDALPRPTNAFGWHRECGMHWQPISLSLEPDACLWRNGAAKTKQPPCQFRMGLRVCSALHTNSYRMCGHWPNSSVALIMRWPVKRMNLCYLNGKIYDLVIFTLGHSPLYLESSHALLAEFGFSLGPSGVLLRRCFGRAPSIDCIIYFQMMW